jgi:hypothetical protein
LSSSGRSETIQEEKLCDEEAMMEWIGLYMVRKYSFLLRD